MDQLISVLQLFFRSSVSKLSLDVVIHFSLLYPKSAVTNPISNMEGATFFTLICENYVNEVKCSNCQRLYVQDKPLI